MNKTKILTILLITFLIFLFSCGKKKESVSQEKNAEELRAERGFPVKTATIEGETIAKELRYTGILEGVKQSRATSALADELAGIYVSVGDRVEKDQLIAEFDEDSPAAGFLQAKSAYDIAEKTYNRMKKLYEVGGISEQQLDEAETQFEVAKANLEATKKMIKILAPISGVVTEVNFRVGDNVAPGDPVAVIADFSQLKTTINIIESDIKDFSVGMPVDVRWRAMPDSTFTGRVSKVSLSANPDTRTFDVEVIIPNPRNILKPGTVVTVEIMANEVKNAIVVPKLIIRDMEEKEYVFVVKDGKAQMRFIQPGIDTGTRVQVLEGLALGEQLVVEGYESITDGVKVNVVD
jgi:RND family efflux transporter MFP subunit